MISLLLDDAVARATLASMVEERGFLAHVAREGRSVVAKAGREADQKTLGIFQQGMECIGILAAIVPGVNAAVRDNRAGKRIVHEPVHKINAVAHPLIGNAAGKILVQAEFAIHLRIEWTIRFGHQPLAPVGVLLAELL